MFLGHFGVALAAKRVAPQAPLGLLVLAAQWLDLVWPVLLLAGVEHVRVVPGITTVTPFDFYHYPYSHSLTWVLGWSGIFGMFYLRRLHDPRGAVVVALLVTSHWLLDFVMHRPDLPLAPAFGSKVGLGLWSSLPLTLVLELGILAAGVWLYLRARPRALSRVGSIGLWSYVALLVVIYLGSVFGPPPTDDLIPTGLALMALTSGLGLVALAAWIDRHRTTGDAR
jgi:hypothetical protein